MNHNAFGVATVSVATMALLKGMCRARSVSTIAPGVEKGRNLIMLQRNTKVIALAIGLCACASTLLSQEAIAQRSTASLPANMDTLTKHEKHEAMIAIAHQQRELRSTMRSDPAAAALHEQLGAAYQQMSESLGGDDPGRAVRAAGRSAPAHNAGAGDAGGLAGGPFAIPGCVYDFDVFPTDGATPIGDLQTVTRTVTVSGLTGFIDALEMAFQIDHEYCGDLDITLTSPAGTTVTVSTDNGVEGSFAIIAFADRHNPGGSVPYASNNGLVTDHNFLPNVSSFNVAPEESFNAFNGEDPNGVWTLTVADDAVGDVGTLSVFNFGVYTLPEIPTQQVRGFTNNTVVPMPVPTALISSAINVAGMSGDILDVHVRVDLEHTWNQDVQMTLTAPDGKVVTLTTDNGFSNNDIFAGVIFDDQADPASIAANRVTDAAFTNGVLRMRMTPEEPLSSLRTFAANGTWTLTIADTVPNFDGGTLVSWGMTLTTGSCNNACPSDTNGDGLVNVTDLLAIISAWGNCVP